MEIGNHIPQKIRQYRLMDALRRRLEIVIVGGVGRTTIYKAFKRGGVTPTLKQILLTANEVVTNHEEKIKQETTLAEA